MVASYLNRLIAYTFYCFFLIIPFAFTSDTSELFEFNKMWMTFGFTVAIATLWVMKIIAQKKITIPKTPLDIPLALFVIAHIIATIFSLDQHISLWGYYSRFNGGLLSILSYVFLFYAFISNCTKRDAKRLLYILLGSGILVALWGLPSHFGYDPTCLLFRGTLDVSCWTAAFQPKIRIFSTMGQPNWLAAYLSVLLLILLPFIIRHVKEKGIVTLGSLALLLVAILFFVDIVFTGSRSGTVGLAAGFCFFVFCMYRTARKENAIQKYRVALLSVLIPVLFFSLLLGTPFSPSFKSFFSKAAPTAQQAQGPALETGGTESGKIRLIVWKGALDAWQHNPIFGSGVETFAFAYYKNRPTEHNLTSEWDYLYNKAHNEYLNYLATTGIVGLGSYLAIILVFLFVAIKKHFPKNEAEALLVAGLLGAYVSILVSNGAGFSIVIINLFFFLIPALVFMLEDIIPEPVNEQPKSLGVFSWSGIVLTTIIGLAFLAVLLRFWIADKSYALGNNLDKIGEYQTANLYLRDAYMMRDTEPVFQDELSYNSAVLAYAFAADKQATKAAEFAQTAVALSNKVVTEHPNNIVFWKTRTRVFYALSQIDKQFLEYALDAMKKASALAPTDARISYNLGVLYGQLGDAPKAIQSLEKTIKLKPDYRDAYYALGLFYHSQAVDKNGKVTNPELQEKAVTTMRFILTNLAKDDKEAKDALASWEPAQ